MQASKELVDFAGGAWGASLNHYPTGRDCLVTTQQIDDAVYVVGQANFNVAKYTLDEWVAMEVQPDPPFIPCDDAVQAWELLRVLRDGCLIWQCGGCDGWIFTSNRPRIGVLKCSTCVHGGVDFRHTDRHVGG